MKKKIFELELHYDVKDLIKMQEYSLEEMKRTINNKQVLDYQEDVLSILKMVAKVDTIRLDEN